MGNLVKTKDKTKWKIWAVRALFTIACVLIYALIFSNSLKTGEQSSSQSQAVTGAVQGAIGAVAPESGIANATGEDYEKLHADIRTLAHFGEFLLLGFFMLCCYFSYTGKRKFLFIPAAALVLTPPIDELLQKSTQGRVMSFADMGVDFTGIIVGCAFAFLCVWLVNKMVKKRREWKTE